MFLRAPMWEGSDWVSGFNKCNFKIYIFKIAILFFLNRKDIHLVKHIKRFLFFLFLSNICYASL
jgi:hypothetical protein